MQNASILIKEVPIKIIKRYFLLWLAGSPFLIMVFGEVQDQPVVGQNEGKMQQVFLGIYLLYSAVLLILLIFRLWKSSKKSVIRLDEKGITMNENDFFAWNSIYDFRVGKKFLTYNVLPTKGNSSPSREVEEQKILIINGKSFRIQESFLKFNIGEIAEIIKLYKERLPHQNQ